MTFAQDKSEVLLTQSWCLSFSDNAGINVFTFLHGGDGTISSLEMENTSAKTTVLHINNVDFKWSLNDDSVKLTNALRSPYEKFDNINNLVDVMMSKLSVNKETASIQIAGSKETPVLLLSVKTENRFNKSKKSTSMISLIPCDMKNLLFKKYNNYSEVH